MTDKAEQAGQRMVAFRSHTRGDGFVPKGAEFTATEEEVRTYAVRENPLAGPLDDEEEVVPPRRRSAPKKPATRSRKAK